MLFCVSVMASNTICISSIGILSNEELFNNNRLGLPEVQRVLPAVGPYTEQNTCIPIARHYSYIHFGIFMYVCSSVTSCQRLSTPNLQRTLTSQSPIS
jgi:hypothetical protein